MIVVELVFFAPQPGDREDGTQISGQEEDARPEKDIEQVLSGIKLVESKGETILWELVAKEGRKKKQSQDWNLDTVNVKFYGENSVSYVADGDKGFVGDNQQTIKIEGNTVITSSNGYILNTEVIFYETKTRTIDGPEPVSLEGPPDQKGDGGPLFMESDFFDANLNTNIINLKQNVRGRKKMSGGRNMKIRSRNAVFSGASNYALFRKDVVIDVDSMTITGPRAKFIYRDNELYSMFINGGVKIKDVGRWGVAEEAEVFFQEDKYIFRGSPKVVEGKDQLVGDEIIVYDGGDRIQVKKAKTKYNSKSAQGYNK